MKKANKYFQSAPKAFQNGYLTDLGDSGGRIREIGGESCHASNDDAWKSCGRGVTSPNRLMSCALTRCRIYVMIRRM